MAKVRKKGYGVLLSLTILSTLAGLSTLLPQASASKPCLLGYSAHCTFTPISTLICFALAAVTCTLRKKHFALLQ
ncbi:MAG: hypothetical protein ONB24_01055 [candidate division KSB1 bacterium]|nr:hypothetical protein [candidate division KSB1 bacterium]